MSINMLPVDVTKKILVLPKGKVVHAPPYPKGTKVEFHFKTVAVDEKNEEVEVIDDTRKMGQPMSLLIGKQFKLEIWEDMLQTMVPGQVVEFQVPKRCVLSYPMVSKAVRQSMKGPGEPAAPHHCCGMMHQGTGHHDLDKLVDSPKDLRFTFEILQVSPPGEYEQEAWQLTEKEQQASIPVLQRDGNALFAKEDFEGAEKKYFEAIGRIEALILREQPGSPEVKELEAQKCPLLLNYALCLMKRKEVYEAITHLNTALEIQPDNVKGLFRRGKCHMTVGSYTEARQDFHAAAKLDPTLTENVAALDKQILLEEQERDAKDKNNFKRMFLLSK